MIIDQLLLKRHVARNGESFRYSREIDKPFGKLDQIVDWCKQETRDEWRWQLVEVSSDLRPGRYIFYFDDERDLLAFVMKWS